MSFETSGLGTRAEASDDHDKRHWEIEKLKAETEQIRRPAYLSPTAFCAVVAAVVALLGAGFMYQRNLILADRADVDRKMAELDTAMLNRQKSELATESVSC
jgi:hypothetical protein